VVQVPVVFLPPLALVVPVLSDDGHGYDPHGERGTAREPEQGPHGRLPRSGGASGIPAEVARAAGASSVASAVYGPRPGARRRSGPAGMTKSCAQRQLRAVAIIEGPLRLVRSDLYGEVPKWS